MMFMYKRAVRESDRRVRMVIAVQLFSILDKISRTKHSYAPTIYKTLIFSLVESPHDTTVRELMLHNFTTLFKDHPAIPVQLLLFPFFKLIHHQMNSKFRATTVDFEFFHFISQHPKLKLDQAVQLFNILKTYSLSQNIGVCLSALPSILRLFTRFSE